MFFDLLLERWRAQALEAASWAPIVLALSIVAWLFLKRIFMALVAAGTLWLAWLMARSMFRREAPAKSAAFVLSVAFLVGFLVSGDKRGFAKRFLLAPWSAIRFAAAKMIKRRRR